MKWIIYLLSIFVFISSCKKSRLKGEQEILEGKWEWIYSSHSYGWCDGIGTIEEVITPEIEGWNYSMELKKSGHAEFYQNDEKLMRNRIVTDHFKKYEHGDYEFIYLLDNKNDLKLSGYGFVGDTLLVFQFPFKGELGCEEYLNYFIRE